MFLNLLRERFKTDKTKWTKIAESVKGVTEETTTGVLRLYQFAAAGELAFPAIEGVDGAGKRTLTAGLRAAFEAADKSVATLAFPRYGDSVQADLAAEALHGAHGDLAESVYAMAVLFALDRAGAKDQIGTLTATHDVVILDRYVASNAAYSAARLHQGADGEVVEWVRDLEYDRLRLPKPDGQMLLAVPVELAAARADNVPARRPTARGTHTNATTACSAAPARFTPRWPQRNWCGQWTVVPPEVDAAALRACSAEHRDRGRIANASDDRARSTRKTPVW